MKLEKDQSNYVLCIDKSEVFVDSHSKLHYSKNNFYIKFKGIDSYQNFGFVLAIGLTCGKLKLR